MANKFANEPEDYSLESLREAIEFSGEGNCVNTGSKSKTKTLIRWVNPQQALVLSLKNSESKDSIFKATQGLEYRIPFPKPVVGLDEKYLRRCLESIHLQASTMAEKTGVFSSENSSLGETESMVIGQSGQWVLGSIMGSKSMANILKSPLFHQHATSPNPKGVVDYVTESPSVSSSPIRLNKMLGYDSSDNARAKKCASVSSTVSVSSDQTSSTASTATSQAMLQCTWKSGVPHFVFTADDQKDVFVANLWKAESREEKGLDYVYSFHSGRRTGSRDHEISDGHSRLVGKMKVSSCFRIGSDGLKTNETELVLFGRNGGGRVAAEIPKKVSNKTISKFRGGPCAIHENFSLDDNDPDDRDPPPSLELAAIVVRDRVVVGARNEEPGGGWGLKFLEKARLTESIDRNRNNGDCSTSMDVVIPAGLHGGPRTRTGGPSSLTERWKSGGRCDCGGWDIGCPLTVLKPRPNDDKANVQEEEFKSFDLVTQGSDHGTPTLRLVNVQDDLYFVHFQRTLSILQSFSIAVAVIHTRSPALRPRDVHELK